MINFINRIIKAIKEALAPKITGPNRKERRAAKKIIGSKRADGKFRGNPSLQKAVKEYAILREAKRGQQ